MDSHFAGARIRLTATRPEDVHTWARWYESSEFTHLFDSRPAFPRTIAQMMVWVDEHKREKDDYLFAVRPVSSEEMIGFVGLDGIHWHHRVGWLSIAIGDPANRGRGYGTEAMRLILAFAFDEINLHRVQLTVFSYNTTAIALYERLGFVREGVQRESLLRGGRHYHTLMYGLLRREWLAVQE